ncbi:MAG: segregation/condensation protein A [Patescibacteria group bacterium]|nr:segregation/condensation protein A [Patescibacteria group bacterium]
MENEYRVKLDMFSGPLEKLLEMIEERQLEITMVSLAQITGDFLEYLKTLDESAKHPSVLADFVVVASRLLLIKSKAILPSLQLTEEEETDIRDLEARLRVYKEFKTASELMRRVWDTRKPMYGRELFSDLPPVFYPSPNLTVPGLQARLNELLHTLASLIPEKQAVKRVVVTLEQKVKELLQRMKEQAQQSFKSLSDRKPKLEVIMLFLAVLHLLREHLMSADQDGQFTDITLSPHPETQTPPADAAPAAN